MLWNNLNKNRKYFSVRGKKIISQFPFLDILKMSIFKNWPRMFFKERERAFNKRTSLHRVLQWSLRIKSLSCRREALFCLSTRKDSHFFALSILCRHFETSQRNLTSFLEKSDFFGLFWIFLKIDFLTPIDSLTENALKHFE